MHRSFNYPHQSVSYQNKIKIKININEIAKTPPMKQVGQNLSDKLQINLSLSLSQTAYEGPTFIL